MKKRIVFELTVGLLMLVAALYTYIPQAQYMYELTFISNIVGAGLLFSDVICVCAKRKWLPSVLFLIETVTISIVFLISVGCTALGLVHFNFSGGMFFLHVINPVLFIGFYLFVEGERKFHLTQIVWSPIFVMVYLLFDYIRFLFVGSFVYGLFPTETMSLLNAIAIGVVAYILIGIYGLVIYSMGRLVKNAASYLTEVRIKLVRNRRD